MKRRIITVKTKRSKLSLKKAKSCIQKDVIKKQGQTRWSQFLMLLKNRTRFQMGNSKIYEIYSRNKIYVYKSGIQLIKTTTKKTKKRRILENICRDCGKRYVEETKGLVHIRVSKLNIEVVYVKGSNNEVNAATIGICKRIIKLVNIPIKFT